MPVEPECACGIAVGPDCGNDVIVDECGDGVGTTVAGGFVAGAGAPGFPRVVVMSSAGGRVDEAGGRGIPRAVGASSGTITAGCFGAGCAGGGVAAAFCDGVDGRGCARGVNGAGAPAPRCGGGSPRFDPRSSAG